MPKQPKQDKSSMQICDNQKGEIQYDCKHHQDYKPIYMQLKSQGKGDVLLCGMCLEDKQFEQQTFKDLQLIQSLIKANQTCILPKWPPLQNQNLLRQINETLIDNISVASLQQKKVTEYFTILQENIISFIDSIKKKMLIKCNELTLLEKMIYDEYNKMAEKENLKEILIGNKSNIEEIYQKIKDIIENKEQQKQSYEDTLTNLFNSYKERLNSFDENQPNKILKCLTSLTSSIDFFPIHLTQDIKRRETTDDISEILQHYSKLFSQQSIDKFNQRLKEYSIIFEDLQLDKIIDEDNYVGLKKNIPLGILKHSKAKILKERDSIISIDLREITKKQVILIDKLIEQMKEKNMDINEYGIDTDNEIDQYIYENTCMILSKLNISQNNLEKLTKLFQQYPILEMANLYKETFIKSNYQTSQSDLLVQDLFNREIKFTKCLNKKFNNTILSNFFIQQDSTYEIIFEVDYKNDKYFYFIVGLTSHGQEEPLNTEQLCFCILNLEGKNKGIHNVIQGDIQSLRNNQNKQFSLKINISKRKLQISDYPNHINIIGINQDRINYFRQNHQFQIGFSIKMSYDSLTIKSISIK